MLQEKVMLHGKEGDVTREGDFTGEGDVGR